MKLIERFKNLFAKPPKKLGLTLGGGGAKGMAHIGALKVFEEYGIKFDMVSGASIGSIVGGLYADGFTTTELFDFLKQFDISNPATLLMLKIKGFTVESLLNDLLGGINIEDLKMPYFATACDLFTGEEVVMSSGNLAKAMACSSAIAPFRPVERENRTLIDGVYSNVIPADVLKANGADVVITISLSTEGSTKNAKAKLDSTYRGNGVKAMDTMKAGLASSDYVIYPELKGYKATDIFKLNEMYQKGYEATQNAMPEILALLKKHKIIKK